MQVSVPGSQARQPQHSSLHGSPATLQVGPVVGSVEEEVEAPVEVEVEEEARTAEVAGRVRPGSTKQAGAAATSSAAAARRNEGIAARVAEEGEAIQVAACAFARARASRGQIARRGLVYDRRMRVRALSIVVVVAACAGHEVAAVSGATMPERGGEARGAASEQGADGMAQEAAGGRGAGSAQGVDGMARGAASAQDAGGAERAETAGAEPSGADVRAAEPGREEARTTRRRSGDGRCEPMPRAGEPCAAGDSFCVVSWGKPGGFSSALWCRGGRWEIEEERNLPE